MADYRLLENAFAGDGLGSLFESPDFFDLHSGGQGQYFEWERAGRVVAAVHFTPVGDGVWRSPARGTFSGFVAGTQLPIEGLFDFHDRVLRRLQELGARRVEVLPAPMAHDPTAFAVQTYLLRSREYETMQCDLNYSLQVSPAPLSERMSYGNLKRLRKGEREGIVVRQLPIAELPQVYATLEANRTGKGHAMSMSLAQLQVMAERFPRSLVLFGSSLNETQIAAALCLRLTEDVLYVFYWGDRPGYASLSPIVGVADAIYQYCQTENMRILDVGTSTIDRDPNFGLIRFKQGLGFSESLKVRMVRSL